MKNLRKLKIIEHISLDGVIQHSADDGDFPCSDWAAPCRTPVGRDAVTAAHGKRFDLLLGRRTCDIWSGFWPKAPSRPIADRLNAATNPGTCVGARQHARTQRRPASSSVPTRSRGALKSADDRTRRT